MIKDTLDSNGKGKLNDKKIAILKEIFPGCFSGDTFDIEKFKKEINQDIDITSEGYELNFLGKSYAKYIADSVDTETVLVPDLEHNIKPENSKSKNIYITGDNLDVLKHLRKSYSNEIKMIYIDPPYNTGGDGFVYKDNFNFTKEHLIEVLGTDSEDAERILNMTSSDSSSHSAWLTFIYPRLYLGRELLKDDGVIFISIDDHENAQLKLLCDDVFGESNFLADLIWTNKEGGGSSDSKNFRIKHEHILVYAKDISLVNINGVDISNIDRYKLEDEHVLSRGKYYLQKLGMGSIQYSKSLDYPIEAPDGSFIYPKDNNNGQQACWRWSKEKLQWGLENDYIVFKQDQNKNWIVYTKQYLNADNEGNIIKRTQRPTGVIDKYSSTQAAKTLEKMKLKPFFDYSKPKELIRYLMDLVVDKDDIILDYFSGSGTTAHAVIEKNSEDERYQNKFIMVQLDEPVKKGSAAEKKGYRTIDEIGRERIIRAAGMIKENNKTDIDYGFKHYYAKRLSESTIDQIKEFDPNLLASELEVEFDKDTILTTWMNQDGHGLTPSVDEVNLGGYTGYYVQDYLYLLDKGLSQQHIDNLLSKIVEDKNFNPTNVVVYGYNFTDFNILTQLETNLKQLRNEEKNIEVSLIKRY